MRIVSIIILFLSLSQLAVGQDRNSGNAGATNNDEIKEFGDSLIIQRPDTLSNDVFAFSLDNFRKKTLLNDTFLNNFEEYEMTREQEERYITLGNPGSAATKMLWTADYHDGFRLGFDQYNVYKLQEEDIRYYDITKPYSKVYFAQGADQSSFRAKAQLARDFRNNVQVSLNYNRINSSAVYENSEIRHTYMHIGFKQRIDSTRWAYSVDFLSNSNYADLNAGISDDQLFNVQGYEIRNLIPVNQEDLSTYQLSRNYGLRLYYFLVDKKASKQYFQLKLNHDRTLYKWTNEDIASIDTTLFTADFIPSELGMRVHIDNNKTKARLSYHIENKLIRSFYWGRYAINQLSTDLDKILISELVAGTENAFTWRGLEVNLDGYAGRVYSSLLLDLHPQISFNYKNKAEIKAGFRLHTEPTSYSVTNTEITLETLQRENPYLISSQELYGTINIPVIGFSGTVRSYAGQNVPVLDETGLAFTRENIEYVHIDLNEKFHYKWLHFNNRIVTQLRTNEVYSMPEWYTQHELYLQGKLFGSLNFQGGINADIVPRYSMPSYSPFYGRFYDANTQNRGFFYRLDPYISIRVQGFRFYAKYENLADLWEEDVIFEVEGHPQFDGRFRLGVSWELRN